MSLEDKLKNMREGSAKRIPAETLAVMHQATRELRESGIMERVIKPGNPLPEFLLRNARGAQVRSADLLSRGAVVVNVFRGHW